MTDESDDMPMIRALGPAQAACYGTGEPAMLALNIWPCNR